MSPGRDQDAGLFRMWGLTRALRERHVVIAGMILMFSLLFMDHAVAQGISSTTGGSGSGNAGTLGEVLANVLNPTKLFERLILGVCALVGVWLIGSGLLSAAKAAGDRNRGFADAGLRIGFGAVVFAIPSALGVGLETLWGRASLAFHGFNAPGVGAPMNCIASGASGGAGSSGLACIANNIAVNVAPIATFLAVILAFLAGLAILGKVLYDMAVARTDGRTMQMNGVATRAIIGLLLANLPLLSNSMLATMGAPTFFGLGQTGHIISSSLTYVPDASGPVAANFNSLMRSLFIILVMFGTLAIIRGLVIIKQVSENKAQGRTLGSGVTHLVAGVMMMNMNWTVCVVSKTFLGNILPFCTS